MNQKALMRQLPPVPELLACLTNCVPILNPSLIVLVAPASQQAHAALPKRDALQMQASRDAVGLNLRNAVVIMDEAHNLVDAVGSAHSAQVHHSQLQSSESQLTAYLNHFRQRLSASEDTGQKTPANWMLSN